ncbi:polysaccharide pyruvyl transferase family protein [Enterococcus mediterraneensis]|uniref:polysaccharide pyruvyl transferase family protein n=1 Tax=Enterococcus mediterraneensis TaxID=2364791 RepID=UPI000F049A5C|nr:polysaccharide pyruvyl transferase family protein [Enterococcus mediterraneensis]
MRIAIQTIVDYNNYGNRLQNYALQYILQRDGHSVISLRNNFQNPFLLKKNTRGKLLRVIKQGTLFEVIKRRIEHRRYYRYMNERLYNFSSFTNQYIEESKFVYTEIQEEKKELNSFDCFVIGSDQVWNYQFPRFSSFDFLSTIEAPKISYAASFGVSLIPENLQTFYQQNISNINYISVRETEGMHIINRILPDRQVQVVLDPTLLLKKTEWKELIKGKKIYDKKYILTYFLDEPTLQTKRYIRRIAKKKNLEIRQLGTIKDLEHWVVGPSEFVNLFSQAEMVFTDSFHACVFSVIFEKYFEAFERNTKLKSMNSRIDTLLSDLQIGDRWHNDNLDLKEMINYELVNSLIDEKRRESLNFLRKSLENTKQLKRSI